MGEFFIAPNAFDESQYDAPTIEIPREVEEVGFHRKTETHGGAIADVDGRIFLLLPCIAARGVNHFSFEDRMTRDQPSTELTLRQFSNLFGLITVGAVEVFSDILFQIILLLQRHSTIGEIVCSTQNRQHFRLAGRF